MALPAVRAAVDSLAAGDEQPSRDALVATLSSVLEGPRRGQALIELCDMLGDHGGSRSAVAQVLDSVSWELFGLVMGCLEQSTASSRTGGTKNGSSTVNVDESVAAADTPRQAEEIATLAEKLALELAEIFSPKELHIMALEHLHAYSETRAKFLEAALQPALKATKRVAEGDPGSPRQRQDPGSSSDDGEDDDEGGGDGGGHEQGASPPPPPPPPPPPEAAAHEVASRAAYEAAASAAETAMEFVGPLVEQACAERENLARGPTEEPKTDRGGDRRSVGGAHSAGAKNGAVDGPVGCSWEDVSASDLSVAAYLGFALSALELAAERSACMAATAATAAASPASPAAPSAPPPVEEKSEVMEALTKAEERLVGLVIGGPVTTSVDLQFVLLHGCRLSYADRDKRRRVDEGGDDDGDEEERVPGPARGRRRARLSRGRGGGLVGLAEAAVGGALPWALGGVSTVAYLVACRPKLREKWLPLVWSRRTQRRLFLPHSEVLMRSKSKCVACKGLELACFVAERLGPFPDDAGAFAFEWEPKDDGVGAWGGAERDQEADGIATAATVNGTEEGAPPPRPRRTPLDPHHFDLASFLQVLVDVMVSCPLPALRARGHAALSALLGAAGETSRFRVLERLVERCPWPNATGLLLDAFRREIDRALRQPRVKEEGGGREEEEEERLYGEGRKGHLRDNLPRRSPPREAAAAAAAAVVSEGGSPFASTLAGDFVSGQLRRACRKGPPASLMMDMDTRTGALMLARYAHALDFDGQGLGDGAGRLKLREPEKLRENRRHVQGFLDELRGAAVTADSAGPEHFRLFILEDAAQQCLEELQR